MSDMNDFVNSLSEDQRKKLIEALNKTNEKSDSVKSVVGEDFRVFKTDNQLPNNRRREPVKARDNQWHDDGESRDIETKYGQRTPRNRETPKKIEVDCHVCGRSLKVDKRYVFGEFYRCNRCGGKK